jgi:membrane associated rhomboid family serine protease
MSNTATSEPDEFEPLPKPGVTFTLIAIIGVLFVAMVFASHGDVSSFSNPVIDLFGAKINERMLVHGKWLQWWRLVTPIFLHGGLLHLCVNSYSLYILGRQIEPFYGSRRYFIIFMVSGIAGVAASMRYSPVPSIGASGAIFGLVGAGIVFPIRFRSLVPAAQRRQIVRQLVQVAAINLAIGFSLKGIVDNSAHIGGLIGGGIAALFLLPDALDTRENRSTSDSVLWAVSLALGLLVLYCGGLQARWAMAPWWSVVKPAGYVQSGPRSRFQMSWKNKNGSEISITDTRHNPNLEKLAVLLLVRSQYLGTRLTVRGIGTAYRIRLRTQTGSFEDIVVASVYDRILMISATSSEENIAVMEQEFDRFLTGVTVLHQPPPDMNPIKLLPPPPAAKRQAALPTV